MKGTFLPQPELLFTLALAMFFTRAVFGQDTTKPAAPAGYFIGSLNLQPVVKFESRSVNGTGLQMNVLPVTTNPAKTTQLNHIASQSRFGVGANYFPRGHNFNVKALMEFVSTTQAGLGGAAATFPEFKKSYALFTPQGQWMFF